MIDPKMDDLKVIEYTIKKDTGKEYSFSRLEDAYEALKEESQYNENWTLFAEYELVKEDKVVREKRFVKGIEIPEEFDWLDINSEFEEALDLIFNQRENLMIIGKAGVGKSSFLNLCSEIDKNIVFLAPTGIAATNIGGQTIHSFFKLPPSIVSPENIRVSQKDIEKFRALDRIVIDEASMLNPNILDVIDATLRKARGDYDNFFAGVQVILVLDPLQMEPIVRKNSPEYQYLMDQYGSIHFYDSFLFRESNFKVLEFTKIYRQKDSDFTEVLSRIREGKQTDEDLKFLNNFVMPESKYIEKVNTRYVTIASTNAEVNHKNKEWLNMLPGEQVTYQADVFGKAKASNFQEPEFLELKENATVMLTNNDPRYRWVNGSIAFVKEFGVELDENGNDVPYIGVSLEDSTSVYRINRIVREQYEYKYELNSETGKKELKKEVIGKFTQFPMKLAFSLTSHKCLDGDTRIFTEKGLMPLKDVKVGDRVYTGHGDTLQPVINKVYTGEKEAIKLTTSQGFSIKASEDHRLFVYDTYTKEALYKEVKDIDPSYDKLIINRSYFNENFGRTILPLNKPNISYKQNDINLPKYLTPTLTWYMGYVVGNGSITDNEDYRIEITIPYDSPSILDKIQKLYDSLNISYTVRSGKGCWDIYIHNKALRELLLGFGLDYCKAPDKDITIVSEKIPYDLQRFFIIGLIDADGYINKKEGSVVFTTSSPYIWTNLHLMLLKQGIVSNKNVIYNKEYDKNYYRIEVSKNEIDHWIFFVNDNKKKVLDRVKSKYLFKRSINDKNLLYSDSLKSRVRENLKNSYTIYKHKDYRFLKRVYQEGSHLNNKDLIKLCCYLTDEKLILDIKHIVGKGYYFDSIQRVDNIGLTEMYDIEVEEDHSFIAEGIVSHNSQGQTISHAYLENGRIFANSQFYVMISRLKSLEGLGIQKPVTHSQIKVNSKTLQFLEGIRLAKEENETS